jgi:MYXO-CTERM domain-containing protein
VRRRLPLLLPLVTLLACSPPLVLEETSERQAAITNGETYNGHPSVGMLVTNMGSMCTSTLVGKKTVLTAGHCIQPGASHVFKVGSQSFPASSVHVHPSFGGVGGSNDIAIVRLATEPQVTPSVISEADPPVGTEITLIGYGATYCDVTAYGQVNCTNDSGIKRIAKNKIASKSSLEFTFTGSGGSMGSTCKGDSGGPAFATLNGQEVVVGVTSRGDMPCGKLAIDTRGDAFVSWIEQTSGGDVNKGGTEPPPPPPDTEAPKVTILAPAAGATAPASLVIKAEITDNVGVTKAELVVDGSVVATLTAKPYEFSATLSPGPHAVKVVGHDAAGNKGEATVSVTVSQDPSPAPGPGPNPTPAPGAFGATCQSNADCTSGICAEDPGVGKFCTQGCDPDTDSCPGGATCLPTNIASKSVCSPPENVGPGNALDHNELLGGCSMGASPTPTAPLALLLLGLLLLRRRR